MKDRDMHGAKVKIAFLLCYKTEQFILYGAGFAVCSDIKMEHINTVCVCVCVCVCGQNVELLVHHVTSRL
jgi:hypothetical protein